MIQIYDTTLRDGAQGVGVSFGLEDKLVAVKKLDQLGVHYIEGGWPHKSNVKEVEFFKRVKELKIKAKIAAFGSTKKPATKVSEDVLLNDLIKADTQVITIFGKSWDLHVIEVLHTTLEENLNMIKESVTYLKKSKKEVLYDAEHFFDGYKANPVYALKTIIAAQEGGADMIVLCDTNGGCLTHEIEKIIKKVKLKLKIGFGIHCHNDIGLATANSLNAVANGAIQVQGTINGYGERCGNTDLCTVIPNLKLKMSIDCITNNQLSKLKDVSVAIAELGNQIPLQHHPYVSDYSFTHKGGMHIDAVLKNRKTFEHIEPSLVGNSSNFLVSDQAGKSVVRAKLKELGFLFDKKSPVILSLLTSIKEKEALGYTYEIASASLDLLILKLLNKFKKPFAVESYEISNKQFFGQKAKAFAKVCLKIDKKFECSKSYGTGPVNAMDLALRSILIKFYPKLENVKLVDYKVRVLSSKEGTATGVRVLIVFSDKNRQWITVGVSTSVIEASLNALVEGYYYKSIKFIKSKVRRTYVGLLTL